MADDNCVAGTGVVIGTHKGDWIGVAPTGKQVMMRYSDFWRIEGDKLAENQVMIDHAGASSQLGVDPLAVKLQLQGFILGQRVTTEETHYG